jgi:hypothetical protein
VGQPFRAGAIGAQVIYEVREDGLPLNLAAATVKQLVFRTPLGEVLTVTASFVTDGTDGLLVYATPDALFFSPAREGLWQVEPYLEMPGFRGGGDPAGFTVAPRLAG